MEKKEHNDILFAEQSLTIQWNILEWVLQQKSYSALVRPGWHQEQCCWWYQCCPLILQLCGVLPFVNTSSLWCKTDSVWLKQLTGLSTLQAPGGTELPKHSRARLEAEGRASKCVQSISLSVRKRPSHAKFYCRCAEWRHSCTCQWWNQQESAPS